MGFFAHPPKMRILKKIYGAFLYSYLLSRVPECGLYETAQFWVSIHVSFFNSHKLFEFLEQIWAELPPKMALLRIFGGCAKNPNQLERFAVPFRLQLENCPVYHSSSDIPSRFGIGCIWNFLNSCARTTSSKMRLQLPTASRLGPLKRMRRPAPHRWIACGPAPNSL